MAGFGPGTGQGKMSLENLHEPKRKEELEEQQGRL